MKYQEYGILMTEHFNSAEKMGLQYTPGAGQTFLPCQENINIPFAAYEKPAKPDPQPAPLVLSEKYAEAGFVMPAQSQHFLPGVTAEMLDWFWANMEKGYYLWAPGSHKKFMWVKPPVQYGFVNSVHMISESCTPGAAVFGGEGVEIHRLDPADFYPFTTCMSHLICEGVFNDLGEMVDSTIHMWEDVPGGINHVTATVENANCSLPPAFVLKMIESGEAQNIVPNYESGHEEYEASQWPLFLPKLYDLWKNHPDPSQNVHCCLEVECTDGIWHYTHENGPVRA